METTAQAVLAARAQYPTSTLADLYDPLTMPAPLLKAHQQLDRAVDRCYRPEPFLGETGTAWNTSSPSTSRSPPAWSRRPSQPDKATQSHIKATYEPCDWEGIGRGLGG